MTARDLTLQTWKHISGVILGLVMMVFTSAGLSANILGLLLLSVPKHEVVREFFVVDSKILGSHAKAMQLELSIPTSQEYYEVVLSKRIFEALPKVKSGDMVKLTISKNLFGSYVKNIQQ